MKKWFVIIAIISLLVIAGCNTGSKTATSKGGFIGGSERIDHCEDQQKKRYPGN